MSSSMAAASPRPQEQWLQEHYRPLVAQEGLWTGRSTEASYEGIVSVGVDALRMLLSCRETDPWRCGPRSKHLHVATLFANMRTGPCRQSRHSVW